MRNFRSLVLGLVLVSLAGVSWGDSEIIKTIPLSIYIDDVSLAIVVIGCGIFAATSHLSGSTNAFLVLRDIGIPVGLFGALAGAFGISLYLADYTLVYNYTAIMLITALYGGIVSGIGIFVAGQDPTENLIPRSPMTIYCATFMILAICLWVMESSAGLGTYGSPILIGIFTAVFTLALATKKKTLTATIADAAFFSSMLCVLVGLIARFSNYVQPGIKVSMGGLVIGLLLYIFALCVSYGVGKQAEINAPRQNWHWLELAGFLVFMYFAPETLREVLSA